MFANVIDKTLYKLYDKNEKEQTHSDRVSKLCKSLGSAMGLSDYEIYKLEIGGLYHDIGKITIQERILNKSSQLTKVEWEEIIKHPETGYRILKTSLDMTDVAKYVLHHHERYDGTGYPKGLKGEEIPLLSRIITVVDSYDAMTNDRSYKETLSKEMAVKELIRNKDKQFDPHIVDIFIEKVLEYKTK